jgi:hypothetical protein
MILVNKISNYFCTNFELTFDSQPGIDFAHNHMSLPCILVFLYLSSIYCGNKYMKCRNPYNLRYTLVLWNAILSLFSFIGALRTFPTFLTIVTINNFSDTICLDPRTTWGNGASGLWVQLFIYSKIPELIDTFFIIARKKPLIFLHWYHHLTVLLYCWHSYATLAPQALYFVVMNYTVHAAMYGYYCLMALGIKPKWLSPIYITFMQISQMLVGMLIQLSASYKYLTDSTCHLNGENIFWGGLMYTSYFALFTHFAIKRYYIKKLK